MIRNRGRRGGFPLVNRVCTKRGTPSSFAQKTAKESKQTIKQLADEVKFGVNVISMSIPPEGHTFIVNIVPLKVESSGQTNADINAYSLKLGNGLKSEVDEVKEDDAANDDANDDNVEEIRVSSIDIHDHRKTYVWDLLPAENGVDRAEKYREFLRLLEVKFGASIRLV